MAVHVNWDENLARELIGQLAALEGALLPVLHALQDKFGYIDERAIALVAQALNVSRAEVFGAVSFYSDFKRELPSATIKLCRGEGCQARGAERLVEHLQAQHGLQVDGGAHDGVCVETVYCLGNCALGPNALHEGGVFGRLDAPGLDALCERAARKSAGAER